MSYVLHLVVFMAGIFIGSKFNPCQGKLDAIQRYKDSL